VRDSLLRQWPEVALDVGKHHGYAFQWFALCALIVGLTAWFQFIRPARRNSSRIQPEPSE
jgi:surfeit locus 1 family protein